MIRQIDHVVILVNDLQTAIDNYRALGFTVTFGGEHADGNTHNALVPFADGSYFELIAFKREAPNHRWWQHVAEGEGLVDFALLPSDTASDVAEIRSRGLEFVGPVDGGRLRPDGQRLEWKTGMATVPGFPFLCGDVTPRDLRVPTGDARNHPNGVTAISGVTVATANIDEAAKQYAALLGLPVPPIARVASLGLAIASFDLNGGVIAVAQPLGEGPLAAHLAQRGPSIYAISLATHGDVPSNWPDPARSHGVVMDLHAQ